MKENNDPTVNWKKELLEWLKILLAAAAIALFINTCVIANTRVPSDSMETTIMAGDRFGSHPQRGDIVIFKHKAEPGRDQTRLVKRVIGLPGETVDIRDNRIYINGSETPLEEPYLPEPMETDDRHFEVPEGCYLMLGDNRNVSADARMWEDPYVPETDISAKVFFRYYPGFKRVS